MHRAVVDTNVWVSALLNPSGAPARVVAALLDRHFVSITSEPLLIELIEVLSRPRIANRYGILKRDREEYVQIVRAASLVVTVDGAVRVCRDPDDDVVIETALRGSADVLVLRDDDLKGSLEVVEYLQELDVQVLSVHQFLTEIIYPD